MLLWLLLVKFTDWEDIPKSCMHKQFCLSDSLCAFCIVTFTMKLERHYSTDHFARLVLPLLTATAIKKAKYVRLKNMNTNLQYDPDSN